MTSANNYKIKRHDLSNDNSLQAWSASDEYLLKAVIDLDTSPNHLAIYNDRFGFLACNLNSLKPIAVVNNRSQEKAIIINLVNNSLPDTEFLYPLTSSVNKIDLALIKIPKSLELFQLLLEHISLNSTNDVSVICSFMTRHFTPKLLEIAEDYFEIAEQSKALKKSRLLILTKKKKTINKELITTVEYKENEYRQYLGVFSSDHIDYATQLFLEQIQITGKENTVLDLASGNGIIGKEIFKKSPKTEIHLMDDSYLAVESAKLNLSGDNIHHHYENDLSCFEETKFDLIVTNPPFHFEYEINIQIPLALFKQAYRCLNVGGNLQIVANKHLNYKVHLEKYFKSVQVLSEDKKFVVYKCYK